MSARKAQIETLRLIVPPVPQKAWIENVEMRQKTMQSHCNNVGRQRFYDKRILAGTGYRALRATEVFRNDEGQEDELQRAAKKKPMLKWSVAASVLNQFSVLNKTSLLFVLEKLSSNSDFCLYSSLVQDVCLFIF